jgi:uncharacterized protein YqgQ
MQRIEEYDQLGSFDDLLFILRLLDPEKGRRLPELIDYCSNSIDFSRIPPEGPITLLKFIGLISLENKLLVITDSGSGLLASNDREKMRQNMINLVIDSLSQNPTFDQMFGIPVDYNHLRGEFQISNSNIPLLFSGIKKLLISLGALDYLPPPQDDMLVFKDEFSKIFEVKTLEKRKKISLEEFKNIKGRMEEQGSLAEEFALRYELRRLSGCPRTGQVRRISTLDVGAGYDIVSFDSPLSAEIDRFIEVKSYVSEPTFHWSANEIDVAMRKGERYYIYLVDINKITGAEYSPIVIRNPYSKINDTNLWEMKPESYFVTLLKVP